MAVPGQITLNSLIGATASVQSAYTNPSPGDTDRIYWQIKPSGGIEWLTVDLDTSIDPGYNSAFTGWNLDSVTSYDVRMRAINDIDGFGPWSNTLSATTLADSFGPPLVAWDEDGVLPGPFVDNVNGSLGAPYNLDTQLGTTANLSNQVRNGRDVWQSSNSCALSTSPTPPSPDIPQPCTIYTALVPFFVDGNARWIIRGGFANIEIRARSDGFILSSNGNGIYAVGTPITDGRLYILECQINNTGSKLRVIDDQGNDTGEVSGNIVYGGNISPEVMAADVAITANQDLPAQFMETLILTGLGNSSTRQARREELLQKWRLNAPDIIEYTSGDAGSTLGDSTTGADGAVAIGADTAALLDDVTLVSSGAVALAGEVNATLGAVTSLITGTVETPPPPPIVPPQSPDFQRMYEHLLPAGEAFKLQ